MIKPKPYSIRHFHNLALKIAVSEIIIEFQNLDTLPPLGLAPNSRLQTSKL